MDRIERMSIINELEDKLDCKLLVYMTGDRYGLETKIATDVFPMFHKHLMKIGHQKRINLFLYSTGGITIAGYALVNLLREFCDEFNVIIPFKAHSCATLISLGADNVIMTPISELSPIDPSIDHPLNPIADMPGQEVGRKISISIEDVNGFINAAKDEFDLKDEDSMIKVFELLASKVHPLTLGAVKRTKQQIEFLARNLLKYHFDDEEKIDRIVNILVRERFSHDYIIGRRETKKVLGLDVEEPDEIETGLIMDLFNQYSDMMELMAGFNQEAILNGNNSGNFVFNRGIIESEGLTHVFKTKLKIDKVIDQSNYVRYPELLLDEGWKEDNEI